jgi:hypothetical protein
MAARAGTSGPSRLRRLAKGAAVTASATAAAEEQCELCGEPIAPQHRHMLDLDSRELMCACRACAILFDGDAAGGGHYRLVPDRRLAVADLQLGDALWDQLRIPVDMAFFFRDSRAGQVLAFYPSPMGPTESLLKLEAWEELERDNPVLALMVPDVEALLVNRAKGARRHWLVPIDECYGLVGLIRTRWRGLTGGREVWEEIDTFFEQLDGRSRAASRLDGAATTSAAAEPAGGGEETTWQT